MSIEVSITGEDDFFRNVDKWKKRYPEELGKAQKKAMLIVEGQAVRNITDDGTVNTGEMRAKRYTTDAEFTINGNIVVETGFTSKQAPFVHEGTKPHWAPIEPLKQWVKRKFSLSDEGEISSIAYLVARKIARVGTKPYKFLERAVDEKSAEVFQSIADDMRQVTE